MGCEMSRIIERARGLKGEVLFLETFSGDDPLSRWVYSKSKGKDAGKVRISAGKFYGDAENDRGMQTTEDAKFYQISSKIPKPFSNKGKTLVVQYSVKHEQNIDFGGGYIKLFPSTLKQEQMNGDSPYCIMFGPDIAGVGTKKVHVIFTYNGKNHLIKKDIRCKDDELTHLYTLILHPNNTYEVRIDNEKVEGGSLEDDWDMLAPKKIPDPSTKKPAGWADNAKMDDPDAKKPEDWDKEPELIPDPDAKKPEDWDDEEDGDWEPAKINNPEFKGEWKPPQIDNPDHKGEWVHPKVDNPEYKEDPDLYLHKDIGAVGFELWQVKSGTIFDNILLTDSVAVAEQFAKESFEVTKAGELKMKQEADAKEEEERKKREEEEKAKEKDKPKDEKDDADEEEEEEEEEEGDKEEDEEERPKEDDGEEEETRKEE